MFIEHLLSAKQSLQVEQFCFCERNFQGSPLESWLFRFSSRGTPLAHTWCIPKVACVDGMCVGHSPSCRGIAIEDPRVKVLGSTDSLSECAVVLVPCLGSCFRVLHLKGRMARTSLPLVLAWGDRSRMDQCAAMLDHPSQLLRHREDVPTLPFLHQSSPELLHAPGKLPSEAPSSAGQLLGPFPRKYPLPSC